MNNKEKKMGITVASVVTIVLPVFFFHDSFAFDDFKSDLVTQTSCLETTCETLRDLAALQESERRLHFKFYFDHFQ